MDNRKQLLDEISSLIDIIHEQTEVITGYNNRIPQIEIDIILENLRRAYDRLSKLSRINAERQTSSAAPSATSIQEERIEEPVIVPAFVAVHNEIKEKEIIRNEVLPEEIKSKTGSEMDVKTEQIEDVISPKETKSSPVQVQDEIPVKKPSSEPDLFSASMIRPIAEKPSLFDKIGGSIEDKSVLSRMVQKPLADIRAAIGINEKFLFLNELFKGDLQLYNNAIQQLNNAGSAENAKNILSDYQMQFDWDLTSPATMKLSELVERRYL
ncbi:MAG: hypothetical protein Q7J34_02975 [Bacteroidales bacterium]|jgi:hypothetical protein|nr:hypothetical protein [Bacteroidales bacterium]